MVTPTPPPGTRYVISAREGEDHADILEAATRFYGVECVAVICRETVRD